LFNELAVTLATIIIEARQIKMNLAGVAAVSMLQPLRLNVLQAKTLWPKPANPQIHMAKR
jgi:hypothetical protein